MHNILTEVVSQRGQLPENDHGLDKFITSTLQTFFTVLWSACISSLAIPSILVWTCQCLGSEANNSSTVVKLSSTTGIMYINLTKQDSCNYVFEFFNIFHTHTQNSIHCDDSMDFREGYLKTRHNIPNYLHDQITYLLSHMRECVFCDLGELFIYFFISFCLITHQILNLRRFLSMKCVLTVK